MATGPTYTPIASTTLGSNQSSITFSSLSGYTDLILVAHTTGTAGIAVLMRFNGDTGSNYNDAQHWGPNGSAAVPERHANVSYLDLQSSGTTNGHLVIANIMNYSNTTTYKPVITRAYDNNNNRTYASALLWRNTSAITSIEVYASGGNLATGSIVTIYGIAAA